MRRSTSFVVKQGKFLITTLKPLAPWIGGIVGVPLLVIVIVWVPKWQVETSGTNFDKDKATAENANRQTAIQAVGGLFFLITAGLTLRNLQLTEDKQVTDRFSKAVEMLADAKLEVRLGGIYALERIAKDSKEDHPVVMEVLTAFIRERAIEPAESSSFAGEFITESSSNINGRLTQKPSQDIQSALTVIGRRNNDNDQRRLNLQGVYLQGADLSGANLQGADLSGANLQEAYIDDANLEGAWLGRANLQGAHLSGANLQEVNLWKANLEGAWLQDANLQGAHLWLGILEGSTLVRANLERASLWGANLQEVNLWKANLEGADLWGANLQRADLVNANLEGADLWGANLQGAKILTEDQLTSALLCKTVLPEYITLNPDRDCEKLGFGNDQEDQQETQLSLF